jgi:hypothetical protein
MGRPLHKRSILANRAAQVCDISKLEDLAKRQLESLVIELSMSEIQQIF